MSIHSTASPFDAAQSRRTDESLGAVFEDARRRTLLGVLADCETTVELEPLAERVVAAETGERATDDDRFDRTLVSLYRCHLPVFVEAALVSVDEDDGVFVTPDTTALGDLQ